MKGADRAVESPPLASVRHARERGDVEYLIDALAHGQGVPRISAALSLGRLKDERGVKPLLRCLHARDEQLRIAAIRSLGRIGDDSVIDEIARFADSPNPFGIRSVAIEALATLGDRRAIPMLADIVIEPDFEASYIFPSRLPRVSRRPARRWAGKKLVQFRGTEAIPALAAARSRASITDRWRLRLLIRRLTGSYPATASFGDMLASAYGALLFALLVAALVAFVVIADPLGRIIGAVVLVAVIAVGIHIGRRVVAETLDRDD